jgi:enoyl-CoA hydratase/carnithine racemase
MRDDLWEVLYAVDNDPEVRAMVLRGEGPDAFCVGADLTEFGTAPSQVVARRVRWERDVFGRLYDLSKPTVAAVHGHVIGSGTELAALCDLRIAASDASFSMPETSLGLVPAAGGTQTLSRLVGRSRALHMVLAGAGLDAHGALAAGLVTRVVPRGKLRAAADRLARRLAATPAASVRSAREALRAAWRLSLADGLLVERRLAERLASL